MTTIVQKLKLLWSDTTLRKRVLFVLGALIVFRVLASIPVPGIDTSRLAALFSSNQFLGVLDIFSGGGLSTLSIVMLGVSPYITSSIIMQLLGVVFPAMKRMQQEEGDAGRQKFVQYSRMITVPLAALQGFSLLVLLEKQGIITTLAPLALITDILIVTAGSMLLMWIGELVSEYGIGNGISLLIFAGIVARLPREIGQLLYTYDASQLPTYLMFAVIGFLLIALVVTVTEAERPVLVTYAKQARGGMTTAGSTNTYIPLRINQAGVMPVIFALSILMFPQMIGSLLVTSSHGTLAVIGATLKDFTQTSTLYAILYFVFVFFFTYFYTAVTFDPKQMSENLQKGGAFIPGIRPGTETENYFANTVSRITLVGALFLGVVAVMPIIFQRISGITSIALGGTAVLIVVSVIIELIKKIDAQISMREY
jgi:preprotein translocase subunit SecY